MFFCSLTVFAFVNYGGVVGPDIRKTIEFKDLAIGSFFFFLATCYTFKFKFRFPLTYETHIVHIVGNFLLLESIVRNKSALTYWGHIVHRWRNNLWMQRGSREEQQTLEKRSLHANVWQFPWTP